MTQLSFDGFQSDAVDSDIPVPEGRPDSWYKGRVLSHSSVQLYQTCPQKWKFRYIDKIPEKPKSFFSFGKSVHASLEFLFENRNEQKTLEDVLSHYKTHWLSEGYETPAQEKWFFQEGERILKGFYAKHGKDSDRIFEIEYKFTIDVEGIPVTGFIDRIDKAPSGGLSILDYKTGKAFDKSRVRSDSQLTLYQMAVKRLLKQKVDSVTLYHLNSLTPLTVPAHSEKMESDLSATILKVGQAIQNQVFVPKVDERGHCQWCDYQQVCPGFSGKKTLKKITSYDPKPVSERVDRLGKLIEKMEAYTSEKEQLMAEIRRSMQEQDLSEIKGDHFTVTRSNNEDDLIVRPLSDTISS